MSRGGLFQPGDHGVGKALPEGSQHLDGACLEFFDVIERPTKKGANIFWRHTEKALVICLQVDADLSGIAHLLSPIARMNGEFGLAPEDLEVGGVLASSDGFGDYFGAFDIPDLCDYLDLLARAHVDEILSNGAEGVWLKRSFCQAIKDQILQNELNAGGFGWGEIVAIAI